MDKLEEFKQEILTEFTTLKNCLVGTFEQPGLTTSVRLNSKEIEGIKEKMRVKKNNIAGYVNTAYKVAISVGVAMILKKLFM